MKKKSMRKFLLLLLYCLGVNLLVCNAIEREEPFEVLEQPGYGGRMVSDGLGLVYTSEGYRIEYTVPKPVERIVETDSGRFSVIEFCSSSESIYDEPIEDYDMMTKVGFPALPVISLNLNLPDSVLFNPRLRVEYVSGCQSIKLQYRYLPAQDQKYEDNGGEFVINKNFYESEDIYQMSEQYAELSRPYSLYGVNGVSVHISPISYDPKNNEVIVPSSIILSIPGIALDAFVDKYHICSAFDTWFLYTPYRLNSDPPRYAIFTTPEFEGSTLNIFMHYKQKSGFSVQLYSSEDHKDRYLLYSKIKKVCADPRYKPLYILLVGHYDKLPFSDGVPGNYYSPPTDIVYSHFDLDGYDFMYPDIPIGRWPVRDDIELGNIIEKTIRFEHGIGLPKVGSQKGFCLFSGTGNNQHRFAQDIRYIEKCFSNRNTDLNVYDGRKFGVSYSMAPMAALKQELGSQPWMFLYRGHGNEDCIGSPYSLCRRVIYELNVDTIHPISFLFGCSLNYKFGVDWISKYNDKGGVACYAPTVSIATRVNSKVSRGIFKQFDKDIREHVSLTSIITCGMVKYLSSYGNEDEKYNNCSKYVLYGDPSLRVFGRNIPGWEYFSRLTRPPYISKSVDYDREGSEDEPYVNILQNHNNVTVNFNNSLSAEIELYDMSGRIVIAERTIESGTIIPLPNVESGVYIMVVKLSDATEFREKIFIKD